MIFKTCGIVKLGISLGSLEHSLYEGITVDQLNNLYRLNYKKLIF